MRIFFYITLVFLFITTSSKETKEQKLERVQLAKEADLKIKIIEHSEVADFLKDGIKILFFGAKWCQHTQRFNPKFLAAYEKLEREGYSHRALGFFDMRKVECSEEQDFCEHVHKVTDGFPTTFLYKDGVLIEEYPYEDEVEPLVKYVKAQVDSYKSNLSHEQIKFHKSNANNFYNNKQLEEEELKKLIVEEDLNLNKEKSNHEVYEVDDTLEREDMILSSEELATLKELNEEDDQKNSNTYDYQKSKKNRAGYTKPNATFVKNYLD
ncbi:hypothetical protein HK099_005462 [Clydaea vesicula]|uniref:Thioredoxin domain-containing protein n=1 Tax=Clydaea vesicula TaxID=447962 RepID=A0AAD5U1K4_9FUNG|nr:hypothetical protein HK099_005462 [Clydaea vesicula]KAJ3387256.1 hypothetical protein HDU92_002026 [Lobulomyces angularis]